MTVRTIAQIKVDEELRLHWEENVTINPGKVTYVAASEFNRYQIVVFGAEHAVLFVNGYVTVDCKNFQNGSKMCREIEALRL